ncbi:MAG: class I SAM-dependent methyltransferase [Methanobacterium sp.]
MFDNFRFNMLNRRAASAESKPAEIIKSLNIKKGDIVADIGSGGGYFTFEFSSEVGVEGKVYAIDTNQNSLDYISRESGKRSSDNIKVVLANESGFSLPEQSVDIIFLRNVFHHLPEPTNYFENIKKFLKSNDKIALIDYNKKGFSFIGISGHYVPEKVLIDKLEKAGFYVSEKFDFLPEQSFMIFKMNP